jgi:hypothetical protein
MLWFVWQLLTPLNYLRIRHGEGFYYSKRMIDWVVPLIATICVVLVCRLVDQPLSLQTSSHFFDAVTNLLALLIAFFMAALAAVATFDRQGLDQLIENEEATLWRYVRKFDKKIDDKLSYREFICYLFGFLSFTSLFVYIFVVLHQLVWAKVASLLSQWTFHYFGLLLSWAEITAGLLFVFFVFVCCQLFVTALLGINFLTERIQTLMKN